MKTVFPTEALDAWFQHRMLDVHTAIPCQVLAYDAAAQTVDVRPQVKHYVLSFDGERTAEALPDLYGVPVAFPRAGGFHMTLPIAAGDYVLVLFSEEPTQAWRSKARQLAPGLLDRHGLNGPFAIPCGFPDKEKLGTAPPTDAVEIASDDGATVFRVKGGGAVEVTGTLTVSGDVVVGGDVAADGDVTADAAGPGVTLTGHTHPSGTGPTGSPTPGT